MAGLCRNIGGCIRCLGRAYRCLSQGGEESIESPRCRSSPSSSAGAAEVARSCGPTAGLCQCRCTIWCPCPGRLVGGRRVGGRGRAWTPVGAFEAPCVEDADRHQARLLAPRDWRAAAGRVRACACPEAALDGRAQTDSSADGVARAWASVDARRRVRSAVRRRCRSTPDSLAGAAGLASNVRVRRNAAPTHAGDGQGGVARREQGRGGSLAWRESRVAGVSYVYEKGESYKFLVVLKTLLLVARMPGEGAQKGPGERGGLTGRPPCEILGL